MTSKILWKGMLIAVLSVSLVTPAPADETRSALRPHLLAPNSAGSFHKLGVELVVGIVVVGVAVAVLVTVLVLHHKSAKRVITGCIHQGASGMSVTDERDQRSYSLSGNIAGIKAGDRMTLEGKPRRTGKTLVFEPQRVIGDLGACQP